MGHARPVLTAFIAGVIPDDDYFWEVAVDLHAVNDLRDPVLLQSARTLVQECASPGAFGALYAEGLGLTMLARVLRYFSDPHSQMRPASGGLAPFRLRRALEYIAANLGNELHLCDLARVSGLSSSQFVRGFRASMGITPGQYVLAQRIERAKGLLAHSDTSLSDIALQCGFADQSYFTNRFRSLIGTTPGQFRKNNILRRQDFHPALFGLMRNFSPVARLA